MPLHARLWPVALLALTVAGPPVSAVTRVPKKPAIQKKPVKKPVSHSSLVLDGHGGGVLKFWDLTRDRTAGHFEMSSWFQDGLAVLSTEWALPPKSRNWAAAGYLEASPNSLTTLGSLRVPLDEDQTLHLDAHGALHQDGTHYTINGKFMTSFLDDKQVPIKVVSVDTQSKLVGWDEMDWHLHALTTGDAVAQSVVPAFTTMDLHVTQADDLTTAVFSATVPFKSDMAETFKGMVTNPADFEKMVLDKAKENGLDVQSAKVSDAVASGQQVSATVTVVAKGLGPFVTSRLGAIPAFRGDSMAKAFQEMADVEVSDLHAHGEAHDNQVEASVDMHIGHASGFVLGYLDLYQSMDQKNHHASPFNQFSMRAAIDSLQRVRPVIEQVAGKVDDVQSSSSTLRDEHGDNHTDTVTGSMDWSGDVAGLHQALVVQHITSIDKQDADLSITSDGKAVNGRLSSTSSGPWLEAMKSIYVQAAQETPGLEAFSRALQGFTLTEAKAALQINQGHLSASGYAQTSPLGDLVNSVLATLNPGFRGQVTGIDMAFSNPNGVKNLARSSLFLAGLPTTPHNALVDVLQLPGMKQSEHPVVKPGAITPPTVSKPTVGLPADLASPAPPSPSPSP